jgi:hypothetical protein
MQGARNYSDLIGIFMAVSTFNLGDATWTAGTQAAANALRDAALLDFCRLYGLDILTNGVPDQAKAVAAVRSQVLKILREDIKRYRSQQAALTEQNKPDEF